MSKKRASSDSTNDDQSIEHLESPIQREDDVKRAKLDPERVATVIFLLELEDITLVFHSSDQELNRNELWSVCTLQDLPVELLERILVRAVVMEVMGLKLAKSVWKEKADLMISRLKPVCSHWSDILKSNPFRAKLHRTLDGIAQTVRLEILHEAPTHSQNEAMTSLKDETFMLYRQLDRHYVIKVYNRDNMEEVKEVIPLPGIDARHMTGCNVSNCVYICMRLGDSPSHEILRISRDVENKFIISPWVNDTKLAFAMSVTANGSVVTLSTRREGASSDVVRIYNTDGSLEREVMLPLDLDAFLYTSVIQKSNGNLVLAYVGHHDLGLRLAEIEVSGSLVRQFQASAEHSHESCVNVADANDRIMICIPFEGVELLDSEFNLIGDYRLPNDQSESLFQSDLHYDWNRNEIVRFHCDFDTMTSGLTIFRFTEE